MNQPEHEQPIPGTGTAPAGGEAPIKTAALFFKVLRCRGADLLIASLLLLPFALPTAAAFALVYVSGYFSGISHYFFIIAAVAAIPLGGAFTAYVYCIAEMIRGGTGARIWSLYWRKYKEGFKKSIIPGIIYNMFYMGLATFVFHMFFSPMSAYFSMNAPLLIMIAAAPVFIGLFMPYIFLLIGYFDVKMTQVLMFSVLASLTNMGKSFAAVILAHAGYMVFILFLPVSAQLAPLLLLWVPVSWLITMVFLWPAVDKQFSITKRQDL